MTSETDCHASAAALARNDEGPEIGGKVKFTPAAYLGKTDGFCENLDIELTGEIVQVNEARRWYRVRYEVRPGCIRFETFKY